MQMPDPKIPTIGTEHWTERDGAKLFLWNKRAPSAGTKSGVILFVHGSSMASQPTFDLQVPGRDDSSIMDVFARLGYDCWCLDMEGYGRSTKDRDNNADIARGAGDCSAAADYIGGAPTRAAIGAMQEGKNPLTAFASQYTKAPSTAPTTPNATPWVR